MSIMTSAFALDTAEFLTTLAGSPSRLRKLALRATLGATGSAYLAALGVDSDDDQWWGDAFPDDGQPPPHVVARWWAMAMAPHALALPASSSSPDLAPRLAAGLVTAGWDAAEARRVVYGQPLSTFPGPLTPEAHEADVHGGWLPLADLANLARSLGDTILPEDTAGLGRTWIRAIRIVETLDCDLRIVTW